MHVEFEELLLYQKGGFLVYYISYMVLVAIQKRQKEGKLYKIEGFVEWRPFTLSGI